VETATAPAGDLKHALEHEWYHTIELAPGIVTPGWFDTRSVVSRLPFPESLEGKRCLDVATFNGFWAFEMERRGAAETIGIDVLDPLQWDWPAGSEQAVIDTMANRQIAGRGFEIAKEALGSSVERLDLSVYDLDPQSVGTFDFVYLGSLLLHLRDPVRALERVRSVCSGTLLVVDNIDLALTLRSRKPLAALDGRGRPWWWNLNLAALVRVVETAGFELLQRPKRIWMPAGAGHPPARLGRSLLRSEEARKRFVTAVKGDPHAAILAKVRAPSGGGEDDR
jgi:tRNA (mo5U34)-methyltransferase